MMQRVFGHYFLAVIFICINASFRGSWKYQNVRVRGSEERSGREAKQQGRHLRRQM